MERFEDPFIIIKAQQPILKIKKSRKQYDFKETWTRVEDLKFCRFFIEYPEFKHDKLLRR